MIQICPCSHCKSSRTNIQIDRDNISRIYCADCGNGVYFDKPRSNDQSTFGLLTCLIERWNSQKGIQ